MYIFVRHTTGRTFTISVEAETTVLELKKKLEVESELPVNQQELTFCEKPLRNEDTMLDCDVGSEAIVKLYFVPPSTTTSSSSSSSSSFHSPTKADDLLEEFNFPIDDNGTGKEPEESEGEGLFSSLFNFDFDSLSSSPSSGKPKYHRKKSVAGAKKPRPPPEEKAFTVYNTKEQTFVSAVLNLALKVLFTSVKKAYLSQLRFFISAISFSRNSVFLPIFRRIRSFIVFLRYSKLIVTLISLFSTTFAFISKSSSFLWNKVSRVSSYLWSSLSSLSSFIWKRLCTFTSVLWNKVYRVSSFIWRRLTTVGSFFSRIISLAWGRFSKACSFLYSKFTETVSYISTKVSKTISSVWNSISKVCISMSNNVKRALSIVSRTSRKFGNTLLLGLKSLKNFGVKSFNEINSYLIAPIRKSLHFVFVRVPTVSIKFVKRRINSCVDFTKQKIVLPVRKAYGVLNRAVEAAFTSIGKGLTNYLLKPTIRGITNLGVGIKNAAVKFGKGAEYIALECGKCLDRCLVQPLWKTLKGFWNHLITPLGRGIKTTVLSIPKVVRFTGRTINKYFLLPIYNFFSCLKRTTINIAISSAKFANKYALLPVVNSWKFIWNKVIIPVKKFILGVFKVLIRGIKTICRTLVNLLKGIKNAVKKVFVGVWNAVQGITRMIRRTSLRIKTFLKKQVLRGMRELSRQYKNKVFSPVRRLLTRIQKLFNLFKRRFLSPVQKFFKDHFVLPIKNAFSFIFNSIKNTLVSLFTSIKNFTSSLFNSVKNTLVSIFGKSLRFLYKEIVRPVALLLSRTTSFIWKNTLGAAFKLLFRSLKFLFRVTVLRTYYFIRDKIEEIKRRVKGEVSSEGFSLGIEPGLFVQSEDVRGAAMVQLDNKQFYSVRLRNNTSHWAECIVNIDGKKIGIFTLPPGTVVIEGPPNKRMRFMFIQDDSVEVNLEGAAKGDSGAGLVQVTFVPQLLAMYHKRPDAKTLRKAKEAVLGSELMEYNATPAEAKTALSSPSTPASGSCSSSSSSSSASYKARNTDVNMSSGRTTFGGRTDQQVSTSRTKVPLDWTKATKLSLCLVATKE